MNLEPQLLPLSFALNFTCRRQQRLEVVMPQQKTMIADGWCEHVGDAFLVTDQAREL